MAFSIVGKVVLSTSNAIRGLAQYRKKAKAAKMAQDQLATHKAEDAILKEAKAAEINSTKMRKLINGKGKIVSITKEEHNQLTISRVALQKKADAIRASRLQTRLEAKAMQQQRQKRMMQIRAVNAFTAALKEARSWIRMFRRSSNKPVRMRTQRAVAGLRKIGTAARSVGGALSSLAFAAGGVFAALSGGKLLEGAKGMFQRAFDLSRQMEDSKVTFDIMLGDAKKSRALIEDITEFAARTPFQRADIIAGSRRLLTITKQNVDENKRLFKLASNVAAIKPGTKVEDVSRAFVSAAFGEFESLKQYGLALRAEQFKEFGKPGGEAYGKAVLEEVEKQFTSLTGGRDLVEALSGTISGKMSTLKDNVEQILLDIGDVLTERLNIKGLLDDGIKSLQTFGKILRATIKGDLDEAAIGDTWMFALAEFIKQAIDLMVKFKNIAVDTGKWLLGTWNKIPEGVQTAILWFGVLSTAFVIGSATIAGALLSIVIVLAMIGGQAILIAGAIAAAFALMLLPIIATVAFGFMLFRKEGESVGETMKRLGATLKAWFMPMWEKFKVFLDAFWNALAHAFLPAWEALEEAFARLRPTVAELFATIAGPGGAPTMEQLIVIGTKLGNVLGTILLAAVDAVVWAIDRMNLFLKRNRTFINSFISDVKRVSKAFWDLMSGTGDAQENLKVFMLGLFDIVVTPFKGIIIQLSTMVAETLIEFSNKIAPLSEKLATKLRQAGAGLIESAAQLKTDEGLLETRGEFLKPLNIQLEAEIKTEQPVEVNMDGETIATGLAETEMRGRNAGRGGDPLTPEEMGFVMEGSRIRTVTLAEVAGRS